MTRLIDDLISKKDLLEALDKDGWQHPASVIKIITNAPTVNNDALRQFALSILAPSGLYLTGDLDGNYVEEQALKFGLLEKKIMNEPCCETCLCAEYDAEFPTECNRYTDILKEEIKMDDLISKKALLEAITKITSWQFPIGQQITDLITNAPTVQREGGVSVPIAPTDGNSNWIKNTGEKPDGEFFNLHYNNGGYSFHDKYLKRQEIDWTLSTNGYSIAEYQVVTAAPKE